MNALVLDRSQQGRRRFAVSKAARALTLLGFLTLAAVAVNSAIIVADGVNRSAVDSTAVGHVSTGGRM